MRYQGKITTWKDDQGFGFITPNMGGEPVFVHIKAFRQSAASAGR
jgi:cold shock CspA family protein